MLPSVQFQVDHVLVRGQDDVLRAPVYRGPELVAPSSGTCTVYDAGGQVAVSGPVQVIDRVATLNVPAATTQGRALSDDWYAEWSLDVDGVMLTTANMVHLARRRVYPVLSQHDLTTAMSSLDGADDEATHSIEDLSPYIWEAWVELDNRLCSRGKRSELVMSPSAFRATHKHLTLALIFEDLSSRLNEAYVEIARRQRELYEAAWAAITWRYDADKDGRPDTGRDDAEGPLFAM